MPLAPVPVLLFTYKRLESVKLTIAALQANYIAHATDLFIFSDGSKNDADKEKVEQVRNYLSGLQGFKSINIKKAERNKGLAQSIKSGVTEILRSYPSCIVLEDDLLTAKNFLNFMNDSLNFYEGNKKVFSISGFTFPVEPPEDYKFDGYFNPRGCSWGWATWRDRWSVIDWKILDDSREKLVHQTTSLGSDFPSLIRKYRKRTIDSWAIPWCYFQFKNDLATLYPVESKVKNIGFDPDATHTFKSEKRFATSLGNNLSTDFLFSDDTSFNNTLSKQYTNKFSYYERLKWRLIYDIKKLLKQ